MNQSNKINIGTYSQGLTEEITEQVKEHAKRRKQKITIVKKGRGKKEKGWSDGTYKLCDKVAIYLDIAPPESITQLVKDYEKKCEENFSLHETVAKLQEENRELTHVQNLHSDLMGEYDDLEMDLREVIEQRDKQRELIRDLSEKKGFTDEYLRHTKQILFLTEAKLQWVTKTKGGE